MEFGVGAQREETTRSAGGGEKKGEKGRESRDME